MTGYIARTAIAATETRDAAMLAVLTAMALLLFPSALLSSVVEDWVPSVALLVGDFLSSSLVAFVVFLKSLAFLPLQTGFPTEHDSESTFGVACKSVLIALVGHVKILSRFGV